MVTTEYQWSNCLSVFDHYVGFALEVLIAFAKNSITNVLQCPKYSYTFSKSASKISVLVRIMGLKHGLVFLPTCLVHVLFILNIKVSIFVQDHCKD